MVCEWRDSGGWNGEHMRCLLGLSEFPFHLCPFVELEMDNPAKIGI